MNDHRHRPFARSRSHPRHSLRWFGSRRLRADLPLRDSGPMRRRFVTLVVLALLSTAGCTSVAPRPAPSLKPAGGQAPASREAHAPATQPSARDALVRSGTGRPKSKEDRKDAEPPPRRQAAAADREPPPTPPPRAPVQRAAPPPQPVTQRPERRPKPAAPRPPRQRKTYDGKIVCDMAKGVTDPTTVALCRGSLGQ